MPPLRVLGERRAVGEDELDMGSSVARAIGCGSRGQRMIDRDDRRTRRKRRGIRRRGRAAPVGASGDREVAPRRRAAAARRRRALGEDRDRQCGKATRSAFRLAISGSCGKIGSTAKVSSGSTSEAMLAARAFIVRAPSIRRRASLISAAPARGELRRLARAVEQRHVEIGFERSDRLADGRLHPPELPRRGRETAGRRRQRRKCASGRG